jgi:hypothetical protein
MRRSEASVKGSQPPQMRGKRLIIIHNHVFKNGGSTIDWALRRNFKSGFVDHHDNRNMQKGAEYLGPYLSGHPQIRAISTHHLRPPLPEIGDARLVTIMMFRHPIERVTSVYNFERLQIHAETLGARYARDHDLREYVQWRMQYTVPPTIRNFHIFRTLPPPVNWKKEVDENKFALAKAYIDSVEMLGFVERFDESMVLFEEELRTFLPDIDLAYVIQNVGQRKMETQEERIERLRNEIGDDTFQRLENSNAKDMELYQYAQNVFEKRCAAVPDLNEKLRIFRDRCTALDENFQKMVI